MNLRLFTRSFTSRRQLSCHFQEIHGDLLECSVCKYTLPATRKYLMEKFINRQHEGKPPTWTDRKRETSRNPGANQPDFRSTCLEESHPEDPIASPPKILKTASCSPKNPRIPMSARILEGHLLWLLHCSPNPFLCRLAALLRLICKTVILLPLRGGFLVRSPVSAISPSLSSQPRPHDFSILWFSRRNFSIIWNRRCQRDISS